MSQGILLERKKGMMKGIFDLLAVVFGSVGLAAMALGGAPLTAENAMLQAARALIVIAFVMVPFCMGRALEQLDLTALANLVKQLRQWGLTYKRQPQAQESATLFFDYFFQPGSAQEWESANPMTMRVKNVGDGNTSRPLPEA